MMQLNLLTHLFEGGRLTVDQTYQGSLWFCLNEEERQQNKKGLAANLCTCEDEH